MIDQARQLHELGVLERLVTTVPRSRVGLPVGQVKTRMRYAAARRVAGRAVPRLDPTLNRFVVRDFDQWASKRLGRPSVVNALSGFATATVTRASAEGVAVCCDRGSWHIEEQKRVLDEEAERIGAPLVRFDRFMAERELQEYDLADRILVPSERARRTFLDRGISAERVVTIPYGVDVTEFVPGAPPQPGAIVSVGTVGMRKGHRYLVDAFRSLSTSAASLTLVGPVEPGWDALLGLSRGDVRSVGAVSRGRVIEELQRASVFALASIEEGLALVLAQAMACGLPVVATESTGVRELVEDGVEGLIVAPADSAALAEALDWLLSNPDRAKAMGAAGRRRVEGFGGWDRYGRAVVAALADAARERA
ncbi:glycosyltransferase family 4 protein [Acidiferrimicrobium sp. IK]|uniref:glycosyltransferase family 4 protein n=1 Tax=Acidiferrimicrobium sp. IK TaxID=2871700 RepID=UPI0021CAE853|nr:glycosyltransferase family 4 protein [Acidiferrimicrobium sp. IK]MCU4187146.1 glycosyltransferase family 4 protein [Acidiferrimicrobium sp. IK]